MNLNYENLWWSQWELIFLFFQISNCIDDSTEVSEGINLHGKDNLHGKCMRRHNWRGRKFSKIDELKLFTDIPMQTAFNYSMRWHYIGFFFFPLIFISWRLITLKYCSGFCHTLTWISHEFACVPHPEPPSHLPPHPIPLGHPSAPALSTFLMHPTWTGDLFHTW